MLACYRYIELNPVRAGMVVKPQDYRWSSYHANAMGKPSRFLVPHEQYLRLGRDDATRHETYRALFRAHLDDEIMGQIRSATNGNYALGGERFQKEIEAILDRRTSKGQSGRPRKDGNAGKNQRELL